MHFQFLGVPESNELLRQTVHIRTYVMRYLIVRFQAVIVTVVGILLLDPAHVAGHVLQAHVALELVLVEEVYFAEGAVGVQEHDVA